MEIIYIILFLHFIITKWNSVMHCIIFSSHSGEPTNGSSIVGMVVGIVIAVLVLSVVIFGFVMYKRR